MLRRNLKLEDNTFVFATSFVKQMSNIGGTRLGFASTFFISVSLINPFYFKGDTCHQDVPDVLWWPQNHSMTWFNPGFEILEAPDLFNWRWSHLMTEENAPNVILSV
ncbi:hypothetical protein OUZ56_023314 [Daphnia magna]|uniref:Uncharacterized protein n=1 Tax=Daphnia magna TaxID=35525 RepID=A0ABR0AYW8_9CRUS|nr:hypothetical protein OUZ56_023314 [Daphnia magna]